MISENVKSSISALYVWYDGHNTSDHYPLFMSLKLTHLLLIVADHFSITCTLHLPTPRSQINVTVSFRKYHKINKEKMKTDLIASDLINNPSKDADTL